MDWQLTLGAEGWAETRATRGPLALGGSGGRNNSACGRGGGGRDGRAYLPSGRRPRPAPRARTRARIGLPRLPAQALPAGAAAAAAAAAPAMDVRLYPSAPAVGARPGAEPAGLAHLDYYHCGKVGDKVGWGARVSRARAWGQKSSRGCGRRHSWGRTRGHTHNRPDDGHVPLTPLPSRSHTHPEL